MSYILTALRRSEAERVKGMVPRLSTRHEFQFAPARRGRLWPAVAVAALVFNGLLVAFFLWNPAISPWSDDQQTGPVGASVAGSAQEQAAEIVTGEVSTLKSDEHSGIRGPSRIAAPENGTSHQIESLAIGGQTAAKQSAKAPDGVLVPAAAPLEAEPDTAASAKTATATQTQTAVAKPEPAKKKPQQASSTTVSPEPVAPAKITAKMVQLAAAKKQMPQIALAPAETSAEAAGPVEQVFDPYADVPELWRMPRDFRSRVPKFSISVHVYAPEDEHRFIIVDRRKYGEGERLKSGVVIEAILPDGVVFQVNGEQFKLTSS